MEFLSATSRVQLDSSVRTEIRAIASETDPQLSAEAWLDFARRQETAGRLETAAEIYDGLARGPAADGLAQDSPFRNSARDRLAVLSGSGSFGSRFEFLARRFVHEAADPAMIVGMGAAASVSAIFRFGTLSRLLASPTANVLTRGAGARWLAAGAAFVPEVGAFWGASRATRSLLSSEAQAWDARSISREFGSLALGLGLLKFGGWASRGLFDRVHGIDALGGAAMRLPATTSWSRPLAEQLGIFSGISLARVLESRLGLAPARPNGSFWSDTFATMLQFHVGGRLSSEFTGARYAPGMQELALRARDLETVSSEPRQSWRDGLVFAMTPEGLPLPIPGSESPRERIPNVFMMANPTEAIKGSGTPQFAPRPVNGEGRLRERLGLTRFLVEHRIQDLDAEYFTPERLGQLLSKIRKGTFNRSERATLQHAIRRYLNEKGLPRFRLENPLVRERLEFSWQNERRLGESPSPHADAAFREIEAAREVLASLRFADGGDFQASPFRRSEDLSQFFGGDLYFLNDASRPTGSFKERGALVEVRRAALSGALHVVTASHGNHGLAVAMAAQKLGLRSTIVVPDTTPQVKVDRLRGLGATVVSTGEQPWRGYEEARDWALRYTFERNFFLDRAINAQGVMRYVHGFEDVVPGQGVAGFEILDAIHALPEAERSRFGRATFLLPTGGGGLTAGVGTVLRRYLPQAKVIAVVSQEAPALHFSLIQGRRSEVFLNEKGLCDSGIGLTVPGGKPFEILREVLDASLAVSDRQVGEAMRLIHRHEGLKLEGSAATGIAALLSGRLPALGISPEHPVVTIFTGGNIDASLHDQVMRGDQDF